jgi:putative copper export protein
VKRTLTIVIGFVHDFAAGCWAATVLAIYWLSKQTFSAEIASVALQMKKQFFWFGIACVFLVFATGAGRTFTYVTDVYGPDAERTRRRMLIIKHVVLLTIFGAGTYWQYTMTFV